MGRSNRSGRRRRGRGRGIGGANQTPFQESAGAAPPTAHRGKGQGGRPKERRPAHAPEVRPTGPPAKRAEVTATSGGEIRLGCPMLSRTRMRLPVFGNHQAPRCALGWALHTEDEVAFCLLTDDLTQCWQAKPERIPELQAELDAEASAAD